MSTQAGKTQENKGYSAPNNYTQKQASPKTTTQLVDQRPEAAEYGEIQQMADNSPQAMQFKALQEMADRSPQAMQFKALQAMADRSPQANQMAQLQAVAQKKRINTAVVQRQEDPASATVLDNGETIYGPYSQETIDDFNRIYNNAIANGTAVTTDVWNFEAYSNGESVVGNYLAATIQDLPEAPSDYVSPATFASYGVQPTYDAARQYADPGGNCYSTSASRINMAYEALYGETPIDYSQNSNGTFTSGDYRTASSQVGSANFGYGVGGALANGGEANLIDNDGVWAGELKKGAALQIWHSTDVDNVTSGGGHSQIFLNYTYDANGAINGIEVFDNSGEVETLDREWYEANETIMAGNLLDQ